MKITTLLLQKGTAAGLTLYQIAKLISRDKLETPSLLELIVTLSRSLARKVVDKISKEPASMIRSQSFFDMSSSQSSSSSRLPSELSKMVLRENSSELTDEAPKFNASARRSSFSTLTSMEESRYPKEFNAEFWSFLGGLMDDLVQRKATDPSNRQITFNLNRVRPNRPVLHSIFSPPGLTSDSSSSSFNGQAEGSAAVTKNSGSAFGLDTLEIEEMGLSGPAMEKSPFASTFRSNRADNTEVCSSSF